MNIPMNVGSIRMKTDKGLLSISRIENEIAYDQDGDAIPARYFRAFPHILSVTYNPKISVLA
jgi:hypothetical protein